MDREIVMFLGMCIVLYFVVLAITGSIRRAADRICLVLAELNGKADTLEECLNSIRAAQDLPPLDPL